MENIESDHNNIVDNIVPNSNIWLDDINRKKKENEKIQARKMRLQAKREHEKKKKRRRTQKLAKKSRKINR